MPQSQTAKNPFSTSSRNVTAPRPFEPERITLVAPMLPLPFSRMSSLRKNAHQQISKRNRPEKVRYQRQRPNRRSGALRLRVYQLGLAVQAMRASRSLHQACAIGELLSAQSRLTCPCVAPSLFDVRQLCRFAVAQALVDDAPHLTVGLLSPDGPVPRPAFPAERPDLPAARRACPSSRQTPPAASRPHPVARRD